LTDYNTQVIYTGKSGMYSLLHKHTEYSNINMDVTSHLLL